MVLVHPDAEAIRSEKLKRVKSKGTGIHIITNKFGQNGGAGVNDDITRELFS